MESAFHIVLIVFAVVVPVTWVCYAVSDNIEALARAARRVRRRYTNQSPNDNSELNERNSEKTPLFTEGTGRHRKVS